MSGGEPIEKPKARSAGLIVEDVEDELIVYDTETGNAHRLSAVTASVWRGADGSRTTQELAGRLPGLAKDDPALAADLVSYALSALADKGLLETRRGRNSLSRRQLVARMAAAGVSFASLPVLQSITNAAAAQTSSCFGLFDNCSLSSECCPGLMCSGQCECCVPI